jgi:glycosyltransferase involved in cell wall biosynthesis
MKRTIRQRKIDCVVTSGPPDSTHLLGLGAKRWGAKWIADFRDGWSFEPLRPAFPTEPQRALDRWMERRVASRADVILAVTQPIVDDFRTRLGARAELVSNGWDPEALELPKDIPSLADPGKFTFVYTGTLSFSGVRPRDPRPMLEAFRLLAKSDAGAAGRVELLIAGPVTADDLSLLAEPELVPIIRHVGMLDRPGALALQRGADALLLLTSSHTCEATMKLFEYMGAGRPIIALAEGNEAARIVMETRCGVCRAPGDVVGIAQALQSAIRGELQADLRPRNTELYRYPGPAQRVAELAADLVSARPPSQRVEQIAITGSARQDRGDRKSQEAKS